MIIKDVIRKLYRHFFFDLINGAKCIPDALYLQMEYRAKLGKKLHLAHPVEFNEKLQWLKLYNRNPYYTLLADKCEVKKIVANIIGEEYVIPTLGVWNCWNEIDFEQLPNQFVLKCTHDSGGLVICKDKKNFDMDMAKQKIEDSLKREYYWYGREWPYKNIKPRIIAEKYMVDESGSELKDYKIFNFGGNPELIEVDFDRFTSHKRNLYTTDWKYMDVTFEYPTDSSRKIQKPKQLDEMLNLASVLSKDIPFIRTDFYSINGQTYFGELTFFPEDGFGRFEPECYAVFYGKKIKIRNI